LDKQKRPIFQQCSLQENRYTNIHKNCAIA
jgi:hypothetical protein